MILTEGETARLCAVSRDRVGALKLVRRARIAEGHLDRPLPWTCASAQDLKSRGLKAPLTLLL